MKKTFFIFLCVLFIILGTNGITQAAPTYIDFSYIDQTAPSGVIERIGEATFSYDQYDHADGFVSLDGGAYNSYGERNEFIAFDNPVLLLSIDVRDMSNSPYGPLPAPNPLKIKLYDNNGALLNTVSQTLTSSLQTVNFNQNNVSKLLFDFEGGVLWSYGDDREHSWYFIDNLGFETTPVPVPGTVILLCSGLLVLTGLRRKFGNHS